jgi:hypothetical protein
MSLLPRALSTGLLALVAVAAAALGSAGSAGAASYTVWSCQGPDGAPVSTSAWTPGGDGALVDDCATGGALRATLGAADTAAGTIGGFRFALPGGATIRSWRVWMSARTSATADGSSYGAGVSEADGLLVRGFAAGCAVAPAGCSWGDAADPLGATNLATSAGPTSGLAIAARCLTAAGCAPSSDPAAGVDLYRSAVDVADDAPPSVGALTGPLVSGTPVDRPQTVVVPAADAGGGVVRTELLVDGQPAQVGPSGGSCAEPYVVAAPCPAQADRAFTVDPADLTEGPHAVAARVVDAAGNATVGPATEVVVAARTPVTATPPATVPPAAAVRTMVLRLPSRAAVPQRRSAVGTARWSDGSPAAGVRLDVLARGVGRPLRTMRRITRVTTSATGRFTLPRSRTSRTLRVVPTSDAVTALPAELDAVAPLHVSLRVPSRATRNGRTATLRGTLTGAGDAAPDLPVLVQSIVGGRWTTVGSVEPDREGEIVWRYRFRRTVRRAAYRFRLVVPTSEGRPWRRTTSARRIVRVVP